MRTLLAFGLLLAITAPGLGDDASLIGFTPERAASQIAMEARFDDMVTPSNLDSWMKHLTSRPQHVGSPWGKSNAEWTADLFREWGY